MKLAPLVRLFPVLFEFTYLLVPPGFLFTLWCRLSARRRINFAQIKRRLKVRAICGLATGKSRKQLCLENGYHVGIGPNFRLRPLTFINSLWLNFRMWSFIPSETLIAIYIVTYYKAKCHMIHRSKISEEFEVQRGVRQGCILVPTLFIVVVGHILHASLSRHVED